MIRQVGLSALSLCMVVASGVVTYGSWLIMADVPNLLRGVASLFVWISCFALGTTLFWKAVVRLFSR